MRVVSPGKYIAAVIPAMQEFLLFKVRAVQKAGDGNIRYGPIPGADTISPATIVPDPLNQWTLSAANVSGLSRLSGNKLGYMFFIDKNESGKLFKYKMHVYPEILRNVVFYPIPQVQSTFQNLSFDPSEDMGTFSGDIELLQLANCKVGFQTFNPTNMTLRTMINIEYVEYHVKQVTERSEAERAIYGGNVTPETIPVYLDSDAFRRDVIERVYGGKTFDVDLLASVYSREEQEKSEPFILNVFGETDGANTTGTFELSSDAFDGSVDGVVIPKGAKAKIWDIEVDGEPCTVTVSVVRGGTPTPIKTVTLPSPGTVTKEYVSRPLVIDSSQSSDEPATIVFTWTQATAAKSTMSAKLEIV